MAGPGISAAAFGSAYRAPLWLPGGNLQTIWPALWARRFEGTAPAWRRERWTTPDGDFVDLDWLEAERVPDKPLLVLFHGLEGSSQSHYAQAFADHARARGLGFVVPHFRGCSGELNHGPRAYHSGDHEEIGWILARLRLAQRAPVLAVGISLGGNALLRWAAEAGIALVFPDTSPRGEGVANDAAYDLGQGAGFYVNATQKPWAPHFRMWDYVTDELPRVLFNAFPLAEEAQAITGHSMGGHGALTIAMSFPGRFRSVSAFAPICNPTGSDWGRKQFTAYLGADETTWAPHDATLLMKKRGFDGPILIDQGTSDQFLDLLKPETLAGAMAERRQGGSFRMQKGYDHSYFFVSTFMEEHVAFHAGALHA